MAGDKQASSIFRAHALLARHQLPTTPPLLQLAQQVLQQPIPNVAQSLQSWQQAAAGSQPPSPNNNPSILPPSPNGNMPIQAATGSSGTGQAPNPSPGQAVVYAPVIGASAATPHSASPHGVSNPASEGHNSGTQGPTLLAATNTSSPAATPHTIPLASLVKWLAELPLPDPGQDGVEAGRRVLELAGVGQSIRVVLNSSIIKPALPLHPPAVRKVRSYPYCSN